MDNELIQDQFIIGASTTSASGRRLIQKWEGFYAKAYYDPVGVLTIGYGSINNRQLGIIVKPGMVITREQADEFMMRELKSMERQVVKLVKVPLTQYEFDAIMSFTYNVGVGALKGSTLLKLINQNNKVQAASQFSRWVKATDRRTGQKVTLRGLVNRRRDEQSMFLGNVVSGVATSALAPKVPVGDISPVVKPTKVAAREVVQSTEGKTLGGSLMATAGSSAVYIGQLLQNPWIAFAAGVVITATIVGLYVLYKNRREYI